MEKNLMFLLVFPRCKIIIDEIKLMKHKQINAFHRELLSPLTKRRETSIKHGHCVNKNNFSITLLRKPPYLIKNHLRTVAEKL